MGLVEQIKKDTENFTMNSGGDGWGVEQKWTSPTGVNVTIIGVSVKHHMGYDSEGNLIRTKNASAVFSEKAMLDVGYSIRGTNGEVNMDKHKVQIKDSTGNFYKYSVKSWLPDETLGLIVCILNAHE